jgi:RimJ/RimL family protein N-acetyltransferase
MKANNEYIALRKQDYRYGEYKIVPIRFEYRYLIMKWRNEQMYHLRQNKTLTTKQQDDYFKEVVAQLFRKKQPEQLLFSYLKNDKCIGYGGLVHINWEEKTAELSFIMQTDLEKNEFDLHWHNFIKMIEKVAFYDLNFNSIFTYAYNLRPHLYPMLEKAGFIQINKLPNELQIEGKAIDVIIHQKINPINQIIIHSASIDDMQLIFDWSNDDLVRKQSYQTEKIRWEDHKKWYQQKINDNNSLFLIAKINNMPMGLLRFDLQDEFAIIGVSIDKHFRGKSLAVPLLIAGTNYYFNKFDKPVKAYIKKTNTASVNAFANAGFSYHQDEIVKDVESYIYIKTKNK